MALPSAFAREQSAAEAAASRRPAVAEALRALALDDPGVPESQKPGRLRSGVRVLGRNLGESRRLIFAVTTEKGALCLGLTDFTSGCLRDVPSGEAVTVTVGDPDRDRAGEPPIVWGYASPEVRSVEAVVAGDRIPATVGDGTYFAQLPSARIPTDAIGSLDVRLDGGARQTIPVVTGPPIFGP